MPWAGRRSARVSYALTRGSNADHECVTIETFVELTIERVPPTSVRVAGASPEQFAALLDALFRSQLGVRPFEDEEDYAVGAEWC